MHAIDLGKFDWNDDFNFAVDGNVVAWETDTFNTPFTGTNFVIAVINSGNGGYFLDLWDNFTIESVSVSAVPLPAAFWLFGTALFGFAGIGRKLRK